MSTFHAYVDAAHFHEALGNVLRFAAKPGYGKLFITVRGVSIRTAMQSIKRRKNPEKWRGEAFEDSN